MSNFHRNLRGSIALIRPSFSIAAGSCVLLGQVLALGDAPEIDVAAIGFSVGFLITGSIMAFNDLMDIEVDRINVPEHPLPSGQISTRMAWLAVIILGLLGFAISWLAGALVSLSVLSLLLIGLLYSWKLKPLGLPGNMVVGGSLAAALILGALMVGRPWDPVVWTFAVIAWMANLSLELIADALDMDGDRIRSNNTAPMLWGRDRTIRISAIILVSMALLMFLPYVFGWLGVYYVVIISLADIVVIYHGLALMRDKDYVRGRSRVRWIYLAMTIAVIGLVLIKFIE